MTVVVWKKILLRKWQTKRKKRETRTWFVFSIIEIPSSKRRERTFLFWNTPL